MPSATLTEVMTLVSSQPIVATHEPLRRSGFLVALEGEPAFGFVGPNWFATVMGTGIIANAAVTLPVRFPGLLLVARVFWVADVLLLGLVVIATVLHWRWHPVAARSHLDHATMAHFYGAPAMALMTVGAGALLVGQPVIGTGVAVGLDAFLWTSGTLLGLWTAAVIPRRTFRDHGFHPSQAFGGWLMPVVPPMVSAATGPLLLPYLPAGSWQSAMRLGCWAMFGVALAASVAVIALIGHRHVRHGVGPAETVPTLWIVLGPLGQSITAAHALGGTGAGVLGYGLPVWGFAMFWLAFAARSTFRALRDGLPFALTWWAFTFPLGTVVTGTSALAAATGVPTFGVLAGILYGGLLGAWTVVATRTARGLYRGVLLRRPRTWRRLSYRGPAPLSPSV